MLESYKFGAEHIKLLCINTIAYESICHLRSCKKIEEKNS